MRPPGLVIELIAKDTSIQNMVCHETGAFVVSVSVENLSANNSGH